MYRKRLPAALVVFGIILLLVVSIILLFPEPVSAQCGEPPASSCMTCHEKEAPVSNQGEWHVIHAGKDICVNCHGGNAGAMDKNLAHAGMTSHPLADIYTDCHSCHPDYEARAAKFASTLGVTPASCATPTPAAIGNVPGSPPSSQIAMPSKLTTMSAWQQSLVVFTSLAILGFFFIGLGWLATHHG